MSKIVYNACHGGFGLSQEAVTRYAEIKGITLYPEPHPKYPDFVEPTYWLLPVDQRPKELTTDEWYKLSMDERIAYNEAHAAATLYPRDIPRTDPALVQVVEELGDKANGRHAQLRIEDVPAGQRYRIDEYDGRESVMTVEDYEWSVA